MKKLYTLLALVLTLITFAQAPQGFNYQATVRNSAGALIVNQNVNFKFNIMLNSATSLPVFSETHLAPTDDLGQVNLVIGQGTATTGSFSTINWGTGNYYLGIELNTGAGYVAMGTTQLLSVPYALYANSAGSSQATTPNLASVLAVNNSANNTKITNLANPTDAQDAVNKGYLETQLAILQAQINTLQNLSVTPSVSQQSICSGETTNITFTSNQVGVTYTWTATVLISPTGGEIIGFSSGNSTPIAQTLNNTGSTPGVVRYIITPHLGSYSGQSINVDVTINTVSIISNKIISLCNDNSGFLFNPLNGSDGIIQNNTSYVWTVINNPNVLGEVNQNIPQLSISVSSLLNTSSSTQTIIYVVTPISSLGCNGPNFTVTVNLNYLPPVNNLSLNLQSSCQYQQALPLSAGNYSTTPISFQWYKNGILINGATNQTYIPDTSELGINIYNCKVIFSTGQCDYLYNTPTEFTVVSTPIISNKAITICSGNSFSVTPLNGVASDVVPSSTTYTWTVADSVNVTGESNLNTPQSSISQVLTNTTNSVQTVVYILTPISGLCAGATFTLTVTVNPNPVIANKVITINSGESFSITPINTNSDIVPANTNYSWYVVNNSNVSGQSNQTTVQTIISQTLVNTTNVPQTVVYTITPSTNNCNGAPFTITVTVNPPITPLPNVTIGTQIWSTTNLDVTTYRDGTPIPQVTDPNVFTNLTSGAWCYYNNDSANSSTYGKLYNWYAVVGIYDTASLNDPTLRKQFAPIGWHVPSDAEWTTLTTFLGGESVAGGKMKSTGTSLWQSPNIAATNESGFSGIPGGQRSSGLSFLNIGNDGYWWSSSENTMSSAWYRRLQYNFSNASKYVALKESGYSVRLVRN